MFEPKEPRIRFEVFARKDRDALAVVDPGGRRWSRGEISDLTNGLSRALLADGLRTGDVLAIICPNCAEYLIAYLAATQIGLYVVPINWHLAPPEIEYILTDCRASAIVVHERCSQAIQVILQRMTAGPNTRVAVGAIPGFTELKSFVSGVASDTLAQPVQGRSLFYTSATTGRPKGVSLPLTDAERMLDLSIKARIAVGTLPEEHVQLCASMLYHGAPLEGAVSGLHMGHVVVLMDWVSPEGVLQLIETHGVTLAYIVPAMFVRLLGLSEAVRTKYSTRSLKRVIHTGAACSVDVKRRMIEWWGPILWEAYGAAEGTGTVVGSVEWLKYPGTVGRPVPGTRLMIVDDEGNELPQGGIGTIYMTRFAGDRFEYLRDPEKTRACHRGEFFTVGDVGYINEAGFLFLCDRKIDMINLSGMKVYPAELESILVLHPFVEDCAVFGIPDRVTGEAVVALIQPAHGAPGLRELKTAVMRFLEEQVALAKLPRFVETVTDLGRGATGKLQKRRLREGYLSRSANALAPAHD